MQLQEKTVKLLTLLSKSSISAFLATAIIASLMYNNNKIKTEKYKEIDSLGNIKYSSFYDDFTANYNTNNIYYLEQWKEKSNEPTTYERHIQIYSSKNINEEKIESIIENIDNVSIDYNNLNKIFGNPIKDYYEEKNASELTDNELKEQSKIKAILYNETGYKVATIPFKNYCIDNISLIIFIYLLTNGISAYTIDMIDDLKNKNNIIRKR